MHIQDTLRHYAQVISNHFRLILFGVIFGSTITFVVSLFLPPVYQASALVKVDSAPMVGATTTSGNDIFSAQAQAVSYAILVTSPEVLQEAAKKLSGRTVDELRKAVSDSPMDNTQLIEIRATASSPKEAADIANTVAITFVQFQETQERTRLQNAANQLSQNLTQAKINIDIAQKQLTILQNTHAADESIAQQQGLLATYQSTYNALLSSNEQLQTQMQQTTRMLSVTQQALLPDKPSIPQFALNTAFAANMSFILMITLVLLQDWLDVTIKTVDDVIQLAGLEPLGSIPLGVSSPECDLRLEHTDEIKNAYSMLGTSFRILSRGERAILVTSPRSGSGTTTAAMYLALSLAKLEMRVLLVDANVHCPPLQNILFGPDTYGPVKSLQAMASWKDTSVPLPRLWLDQWKTDVPNLWLLPVGAIGPTSTSPVHEPMLGQLVDRLLGRMPHTSKQPRLVDVVIFDTTALDQGTDAYLLAALADATVLVVEAGKEYKETLCQLSITFQRFGAPILGVVVNRQRERYRNYFYAPRRVSVKREGSVSSPLDQALVLPLPQENTSGEKKGLISVKQSLTLKSLVDRKSARKFYRHEGNNSENIGIKGSGSSIEIGTAGIKIELPETPMPLPLVSSDVTANRSMANQTGKVQEDTLGKQQFAPLLRFSRAMSQNRKYEIPFKM